MADFFFKTTRTEAYLLAIPVKYRYVLTLGLIMILTVCWIIFVYQPLQSYQNFYEQKYKELITLQEVAIKKEKQQQQLEQLYLKDMALLNQEKKSYNAHNSSLHQVVTNIFNYAHNAQITLNKHIPHEIYDHGWYTSHYFNDELQGSFEIVIQFLKALKNNPCGIFLQKLIITKNNDQLHLKNNDQLHLNCMFVHNSLSEELNEKK